MAGFAGTGANGFPRTTGVRPSTVAQLTGKSPIALWPNRSTDCAETRQVDASVEGLRLLFYVRLSPGRPFRRDSKKRDF